MYVVQVQNQLRLAVLLICLVRSPLDQVLGLIQYASSDLGSSRVVIRSLGTPSDKYLALVLVLTPLRLHPRPSARRLCHTSRHGSVYLNSALTHPATRCISEALLGYVSCPRITPIPIRQGTTLTLVCRPWRVGGLWCRSLGMFTLICLL
jgi:hypothetical protein